MLTLSLIPSGVTAWTKEATRRIVRDYRKAGHPIDHVWGYSSDPKSDHRNHRCVDLMITSKRDGDWIFGYLRRWENQLRIRYIIWYGHQWRDYQHEGVPWHAVVRYYGTNQHHDHLHVEFDE
jgi:hypothetical protein